MTECKIRARGVPEVPHDRRSGLPPRRRADPEANDLSAALWTERRHLTELLGILNERTTQMPEQGNPAIPTRLQRKVDELRTAGLARTLAADALSQAWGMSDEPTLPEVVVHAHTQPWVFIFSSHLDSMEDLLDQIGHSPSRPATAPASPHQRSKVPYGISTTDVHTSTTRPSNLIPRTLLHFIHGPLARPILGRLAAGSARQT